MFEFGCVADGGKSVVISNKVEAFVVFLEFNVLAHGAEVIAKMRSARGLHAGKDTHEIKS